MSFFIFFGCVNSSYNYYVDRAKNVKCKKKSNEFNSLNCVYIVVKVNYGILTGLISIKIINVDSKS